jgi:DnaJ domain
MNDYTHAYRLLGVPPNCSLQVLKAARRRLVKSWHPDHFAAGTEMRRQAEERTKDINTAFEHLLSYYKKFGALPRSTTVDDVPPSSPVVVNPIPTKNVGAPGRAAPEIEPSPPADNSVLGTRLTSPVARWIAAAAVVALTLATARIVLQPELRTDPGAAVSSQIASQPLKTSDSRQTPPASPARNEYFTIGSTLGEVYAAQGVPTATSNGVWRYGKSTVYFANGLVTSWEEDPADPLKATMLSISMPQTPRTFSVGSTKEEVLAAEGAPLFETAAFWDYGLSKVYFRDDRVVSWESSPMRPLKVRK